MPAKKETTKEATTKTSPPVTQVLAEVEFRSFNPTTGEKKSNPFNQYYTVEDWKALKVHGPNMGLFVNKVIEAPDGVDESYPNPGTKKK